MHIPRIQNTEEEKKGKKEREKAHKHKNKTTTTTTTTKNNQQTPHPPPPQENEEAEYSRCRQHTGVTCKSKHCHIWLNTYYGGGGGGGRENPFTSIFAPGIKTRGENIQWRLHTFLKSHSRFKLWFQERKLAVDLVIPRGVCLNCRWIYLGREDNFYLASFV